MGDGEKTPLRLFNPKVRLWYWGRPTAAMLVWCSTLVNQCGRIMLKKADVWGGL